jgi:hypothetical protein
MPSLRVIAGLVVGVLSSGAALGEVVADPSAASDFNTNVLISSGRITTPVGTNIDREEYVAPAVQSVGVLPDASHSRLSAALDSLAEEVRQEAAPVKPIKPIELPVVAAAAPVSKAAAEVAFAGADSSPVTTSIFGGAALAVIGSVAAFYSLRRKA